MRHEAFEPGCRDDCRRRLRHISRMEHRIVMNYHHSVAGRVDIELDGFGAELDSPFEGGDRVLGQFIVRSAVRDSEGRAAG